MADSFLSILLLVLGFGVLFLAGLPIAAVLHKPVSAGQTDRGIGRDLWALAPFMGFMAIGTILKTTTRLGLPIKYTAWPMLATVLCVFIFFLWRCKKKDIKLPLPSRRVSLLFCAVVVLLSIGYIVVGAKYYAAYGWWDTLNYGPRVDVIKDFSVYDIASLNDKMPFLSYFHFKAGLHRASTGVLQAMLAALSSTDGVCTMGFLSVLGPALTFCAMVYLSGTLKGKKALLEWGAFFAAMLPSIVLTDMECFWGVGTGLPLLLVLCRLLPEMFDSEKWQYFLITGLLASCLHTTLADANAVFLLIFVATFIYYLFSRSIKWKRLVKNLIIFLGAYIVPNLLYRLSLSAIIPTETLDATTQAVLTGIFPFAYSIDTLNWTFFGVLLEGSASKVAIIIRFLSIALFIAGFVGIVFAFLRRRTAAKLNCCLLIMLPFGLLCFAADYRYPFFKLFCMASPLLVLGAVLLLNELLNSTEENFMNHSPRAKGWKTGLKTLLVVCLIAPLSLSTAFSVQKVIASIPGVDTRLTFSARLSYLNESRSDNIIPIYERLSSTEGENYLVVSDWPNTRFWWMCYYGRNNNLYTLFEENDDVYAFDMDFSYTDLENVPSDAQIVLDPNIAEAALNIVTDTAKQDKIVAMPIGYYGDETYWTWRINNGAAITLDKLDIRMFSNIETTGTLTLYVDVSGNSAVTLRCGGEEYSANASGCIEVPLKITAGGASLVFESDRTFVFKSCTLELN